jgi:hypothetical protein
MELLERYLQAVRFLLPRRDQDDIIRELAEDLASQMEEREQALGRALTEDEQAEILQRYGHPMVVAGRYRSRRQLIGPVFFPMYLFTLQLGLGAALLVTLALGCVDALLRGDVIGHLIAALLAYPGRALMVFAWTTLGFAALDLAQSHVKLTHKWDPRKLPVLGRPDDWMSRKRAVCEAFATVAAIAWLVFSARAPFAILGLHLAPVWTVVYVPMVLVAFAILGLSVMNIAYPVWTPSRSYARIAIHAAGLVIVALLLRADEWVIATPGALFSNGAPSARIAELVNNGIEAGLVIAFLAGLSEIVREWRRMQSLRRISTATPRTQGLA